MKHTIRSGKGLPFDDKYQNLYPTLHNSAPVFKISEY